VSVLITGGHYLFVEHVLSETNPFFATAQRLATPEHVQAADGCLGAVSLYITCWIGYVRKNTPRCLICLYGNFQDDENEVGREREREREMNDIDLA